MEAEDRILLAVGKVEKKVDTLTGSFNKSKLETAVAIAQIQQVEASCPIGQVVETLRDVEKISEQNKRDARRTSAIIASAVGGIWAAILAFIGWHQKGG